MSVQNGERLATKQDLKDMYDGILPYLGGMPEVLANKFSKGDMYSTDEKMIGQWIDGKPLYQKTLNLSVNCPVNTRTDLFLLDSSYDNILIANAKAYYSSVSNWYLSPYDTNINQSNNNKMVINYDGDSKKIILLNSGFGGAFTREIITIQYTKVNDSAISIGSDTDYSTEEKIVGTWIDGKPLYQKTFSYDTAITVTSTENTVLVANLDSLNIDNAVNLMVSFKWNGISHNTPFINYVTAGEIYVVAFVNRNDNSDVIEFKAKRPSGTTEITEVKATIQYTKTTDTPNT